MNKRDIIKYYIALFDRIPEKEAVDNWYNEAIHNKWGETELTAALLNAAVAVINIAPSLKEIYPQYENLNTKDFDSVKKVIISVYKALFDKDYSDDPQGIDEWSEKIVNNKITLPDAIVAIEHFAEDVYNNKIDLKKAGYSDEEIGKIHEAVDTYESRVDFAEKVSNIIDEIKVNNDSLSLLEQAIFMIHSKEDYDKACHFLEENLSHIVFDTEKVESNLDSGCFFTKDDSNNAEFLLDSSENLGYIDLPDYYKAAIEDNMDIHY